MDAKITKCSTMIVNFMCQIDWAYLFGQNLFWVGKEISR